MKISIGNDAHGYRIKAPIIEHLEKKGHQVVDVGTNEDAPCDYPLFAKEAAKKVANKECDLGIVICSSGEGVMMVANKVKGIRCGLAYNDDVARLMKEHNDANMIAFGASFTSIEDIIKRIDIFMNSTFDGGRHQRRIDQFE